MIELFEVTYLKLYGNKPLINYHVYVNINYKQNYNVIKASKESFNLSNFTTTTVVSTKITKTTTASVLDIEQPQQAHQ